MKQYALEHSKDGIRFNGVNADRIRSGLLTPQMIVKRAIEENPEIDEFIINIGGKERDGVTPEEAIQIWDIYKQYLPISANINIKYSNTPPIKATYDYAKNNPNEEVLFILGAREGNEDDFKDISKRTTKLDNYPNMELRTIVTTGGASGTAARQAGQTLFLLTYSEFAYVVPLMMFFIRQTPTGWQNCYCHYLSFSWLRAKVPSG